MINFLEHFELNVWFVDIRIATRSCFERSEPKHFIPVWKQNCFLVDLLASSWQLPLTTLAYWRDRREDFVTILMPGLIVGWFRVSPFGQPSPMMDVLLCETMEALTFCWQWQQGSWSRGNWIIILMTRRTTCAALDWSFLTWALLCPEVTCSLQTKKLGEMNLYMVSLFNSSTFNSKYLHISCRKVWIPWLKDQSTIGMLNCWGRTVLEGGQILNFNLK